MSPNNPSTQRRNAQRRDPRKGAVIVEFALGFIVFIMLIFGIMEGARLVWTYTTLSHAAREGARFAMVHGSRAPVADSAVEALVKNRVVGLDPADVTVTTVWEDAAKSGSSTVRVEVDYTVQLLATALVFQRSTMDLRYVARAVVAE